MIERAVGVVDAERVHAQPDGQLTDGRRACDRGPRARESPGADRARGQRLQRVQRADLAVGRVRAIGSSASTPRAPDRWTTSAPGSREGATTAAVSSSTASGVATITSAAPLPIAEAARAGTPMIAASSRVDGASAVRPATATACHPRVRRARARLVPPGQGRRARMSARALSRSRSCSTLSLRPTRVPASGPTGHPMLGRSAVPPATRPPGAAGRGRPRGRAGRRARLPARGRREVRERGEHERPLVQSGVRDDEVGFVHDGVAYEQHVDVQRARAPVLAPDAMRLRFEVLRDTEQPAARRARCRRRRPRSGTPVARAHRPGPSRRPATPRRRPHRPWQPGRPPRAAGWRAGPRGSTRSPGRRASPHPRSRRRRAAWDPAPGRRA